MQLCCKGQQTFTDRLPMPHAGIFLADMLNPLRIEGPLEDIAMATETRTTAPKPTYVVKQVEQVVKGTDVMVRLFTLSADDVIPWHSHSESTDHYFVLAGTLRITTRDPEADHVLV